MLFDPDMAFIQEITSGDVPLSVKTPEAVNANVIPV
jgi:hypothetical protein